MYTQSELIIAVMTQHVFFDIELYQKQSLPHFILLWFSLMI